MSRKATKAKMPKGVTAATKSCGRYWPEIGFQLLDAVDHAEQHVAGPFARRTGRGRGRRCGHRAAHGSGAAPGLPCDARPWCASIRARRAQSWRRPRRRWAGSGPQNPRPERCAPAASRAAQSRAIPTAADSRPSTTAPAMRRRKPSVNCHNLRSKFMRAARRTRPHRPQRRGVVHATARALRSRGSGMYVIQTWH